jgi:hypothetical protein
MQLAAGTYYFQASAPFAATARTKAKIQDITAGAAALIGQTMDVSNASGGQNCNRVEGYFSLSTPKTFEVQHQCQTTVSTTGLGEPASFGDNEVYTVCNVRRIV